MKARGSLGFCLLLMSVLILAAGCPSPQKTGKLVGWVTDESDTPLPFVKVSAGGKSAHTDGSGLFSIDSVRAEKDLAVSFTLEGYADTSKRLAPAADATTTVNVVMKAMNVGKAAANVNAGGNFSDGTTTLTLPANAVDAGGAKAAAGAVEVTTVDLAHAGAAASLPGGLSATADAGAGLLYAYALAHVSVNVGGVSVDLGASAAAGIRMRATAGSSLHAGDSVNLWHYDVDAGAWAHAGSCVVVQSGSALYLDGTISHLGWWCCGATKPQLFTIRGHVYDAEGQPVANAQVVARGVDYHGEVWAASDADGAYSVRAFPNAQVRLELVLPGAYYVCDTLTVATGAAGDVLEGQDLAPDFKSCVMGIVTQEDGATPIKDEHVYSSTGGSAVTEVDGSFCMPAPGSTNVAVYVLGRPPMFVQTPAAATCADANGAEVTLSVSYPKDGDRLGFVFGSLRDVNVPFVGNRTFLSTKALFYSGFKGEQFAPYDPDAPLDGYTVHTAQSSSVFDWSGLLGLQLAFNINFEVNETFNLGDEDVPSITKIGALDAGAPANVTNGNASFRLLRPLDFFYTFEGNGSLSDLGYASLEPWMGGFFFQEGLWSDDFAAGDSVSLSWPGGIDMSAFTAQAVLPGSLQLTAPTDLSNILSDDALANGLSVTWPTTGQGTYVTLLIESIVVDGLFGPIRAGAVVCKAADDGEYVVPPEALAQLPRMNAGGTQINYLFAKRHTIAKADVPLARGDGSGYVLVAVDSAPVKLWSLDWRVGK